MRLASDSDSVALKSCCPPLNKRKVSAKVIEFKSDFHAMEFALANAKFHAAISITREPKCRYHSLDS
jgi:hypothetical protein